MGDAAEGRRGVRRSRRRLSRSGDFDRVFREGRSHANRYLIVYSFPRAREEGEPSRFGVSVGRKVGGAVARNRVKRLLRDAFTACLADLPEGSDFVVVARPDAAALADERGESGIEEALREALAGAGVKNAGDAA